ncbi:hypothetical protein [Sphingobacterium suaedae]|uniref:HTH luxR-type domain-containing protein n=1 Tax=Sphingobacterium suaedae TaxID=1686402 RepID=A0ABW5KMX3_9SPHI
MMVQAKGRSVSIMLLGMICWFSMARNGIAQTWNTRVANILDSVERLQFANKPNEALALLAVEIQQKTHTGDDLSYLYAHQSGILVSEDSLVAGKKKLDLSMAYAQSRKAKAVAFRASAFLNNYLDKPGDAIRDALHGLTYIDNGMTDLDTEYHLNYILYSAYSKWDNRPNMEKYIRKCMNIAHALQKPNLLANANNGLASMYTTTFKERRQTSTRDSIYACLRRSFLIQRNHRNAVSGNTYAITCVNLANYFLEYAEGPVENRKKKANIYLTIVEDLLKKKQASPEKWINIYGIKSDFAKKEGDTRLAEELLQQALNVVQKSEQPLYKQEHRLFQALGEAAFAKGDYRSAYTFQRRSESLQQKIVDQEQLLYAQKLEIQYETDKKNEQVAYLTEIADFRRRQNFLYGGIAIALLLSSIGLFTTYHFRLRYAQEREKKMEREKEDAKRRAFLQVQIEKEEQARLKAEQELLEWKRQQLEKEALANSLLLEQKNEMLKQIHASLKGSNPAQVNKLFKEDLLHTATFEDIKQQIQKLHPNFFNQLTAHAVQKLTGLDLKYCAYIHLKMNTKQIAQALHIEPQSVRMFKYRLKQKLGLSKESDLDDFIQKIGL